MFVPSPSQFFVLSDKQLQLPGKSTSALPRLCGCRCGSRTAVRGEAGARLPRRPQYRASSRAPITHPVLRSGQPLAAPPQHFTLWDRPRSLGTVTGDAASRSSQDTCAPGLPHVRRPPRRPAAPAPASPPPRHAPC